MKTFSTVPVKERSQEVACNLCLSNHYKTALKSADFLFVKCSSCGLIYQNPQPVFPDLKGRYTADYFKYEYNNEDNFFGLMKLGLKDIGMDRLKPENGQGRFLDIGCATGKLLEDMRSLGWQVQGVDLCRKSAEYGWKKRKVKIFAGTLEKAAFQSESFNIIHSSHLIEHVPDPRTFIREIKRILMPGGKAIITTPNISGFQARLFRQGWRSAIADHLTLFSISTLKRLLREEGFKVLKIRTWGGLAVGTAPLIIKKPVDYLAKKFGFGDVMLFLVEK